MLLARSLKCWTILCFLSICIALVNSAVLAQLARANQARVVARQTTQRQIAQARAAANAAAARTRAQALLGPGRLGLARHGAILGDSQRVTRDSGDFFNEDNGPVQDQISFNNDFENGNNRETVDNGDFVLDEPVGATMNQEPLGDRANFKSNEILGAAIVQEPGANCGCQRRIVIIPEETETNVRESESFTVLSDSPIEARMMPDHNQEIDLQGETDLPQFDENVGVERTHLAHKLHKKLHGSPQNGFQQGHNPPINVHISQNQHLAALSRASSGEMEETESDATSDTHTVASMTPNRDQDEDVEGVQNDVPKFDENIEIERTHLVHKLHQKLHGSSNSGFQQVQNRPINMHIVQNQHLAASPRAFSGEMEETEDDTEFFSNQEESEIPQADVGALELQDGAQIGAVQLQQIQATKNTESNQQSDTRNDQVGTSENRDQKNEQAMAQTTTSLPTERLDPQKEQVTDKMAILNERQIEKTERPFSAAKTNSHNEQVGVTFSADQKETIDDVQVGIPLNKPSMDGKDIDQSEEQVGAPLDDLVEKIESRLTERLGAERTHHIHEILHKNLHRPQAASQHAQVIAPVNVHVNQNQHAIVAPRMSSADEDSKDEEPSGDGDVKNTEPAATQKGHTGQVTGNTGSSGKNTTGVTPANPQVGLSAPIDETQSQNEEQVGAPAPNEQINGEEQVGAFLHQNIHKGVFVAKPPVLHGFGLRPAGLIVHNQHSIFGMRSASEEEDESGSNTVLSNNAVAEDTQSQTSGQAKAVTPKTDNLDPTVLESVATQTDDQVSTNTPTVAENNQTISSTPTPAETTTALEKADVQKRGQVGGERTAHLVHKLHKKLHGSPGITSQNIHGVAPVNIHVTQHQGATLIPRESSSREAMTSKNDGNLGNDTNSAHPGSETPSTARHLNHGFVHRHEHIHSSGTVLPGISSFLNGFAGGTSSNVNVFQNQNAVVSPQTPSILVPASTNVNVVQNQNAAIIPQRPTTFIPSSGGSTKIEVFQNQNAMVAPQGQSAFIPSSGGVSNVFQSQNAVVGPQLPATFGPVDGFGGASTNFNQGVQSMNVVQDQKTVIHPGTSQFGGQNFGNQGNYQGLPSIQKPFGHLSGHASIFQSQSASIGRDADDDQPMEEIDVPDLAARDAVPFGDDIDDNTNSDEMVGTFLHPHDPYYDNTNPYYDNTNPYYDNDNPDKTKVIDLIEDNKRKINKMIDSIKSKHDKILDSLKPKLKAKKHKQVYKKPQYPEEPQYQQYPTYAHDYNDQLPEVSWEYDPSYRTNSGEASKESSDIQISPEERIVGEDSRNIDSDSLRFERSTKVNLDKLLEKEEEAVTDLKKFVKRDEDLMMIDYVAEKMVNDINEEHGHRRNKRQILADKHEFQRIITDPHTKLDMTKTLENVGTVARSAIEHQRAPLYHFRNAVGSVRDAVVATMKIPNQNFIIPAQYDIVNQQDAPQLGSRFGGENEQCSDDPVTDTFQRVGSVVRSTIKSGQEAIGHIGQAANHARTAIQTTQQATPRLRLAKIPARIQNPRLSSRMGGDESVGEPEPKDFVNLGRIMDAVGISNPESTVGSESIVFVPRSRMAAMRNRFRVPEVTKRNQQDSVVGATMKNLREAQQAVGAHSLGDLFKRMRDGIQGFLKHDILGIQDDSQQSPKKNAKQPKIGSRSSIPTTEAQTKQSSKSASTEKASNVTQTQRSGQDEIVGSGLPLAPELLHPFMNRATFDQEKKFIDMFNSDTRSQSNNDQHLGDVLGSINPVMFQRVFQEKLKTNNNTNEDTPHGVFHHHHDGHSHGEHEVLEPDEKSANVSTSMKIQGVFLKPFMGQPSRKNKEKFFSKYQKSSEDQSQENLDITEIEDGSEMQSISDNDLQDVN